MESLLYPRQIALISNIEGLYSALYSTLWVSVAHFNVRSVEFVIKSTVTHSLEVELICLVQVAITFLLARVLWLDFRLAKRIFMRTESLLLLISYAMLWSS